MSYVAERLCAQTQTKICLTKHTQNRLKYGETLTTERHRSMIYLYAKHMFFK